jgi:spermidine synthase
MLTISPNVASVHNNLGFALMESNAELNDAIHHFRQAVEIDPQSARCQDNLAFALIKVGEPKAALTHLRDAVRLNRDYIPALQRLAWMLATHPDPAIQNAGESLQLAQRVSRLLNHRSAAALDTLAAAWAANGHFDQAVAIAKKALWVTSMSNENELADCITKRLELYQQGKPYREYPIQFESRSTAVGSLER